MKYISVIEVSPTFVEMIICQEGSNSYEIIEKVREDINLFKGYQKTGKISFEKSQKLCEILKQMKELSLNYGVDQIQIVTTSSFNQLDNLAFLLDQIVIHTGLQVSIPRLLQKKKLLFKKFLKFKDKLTKDKKNTAIVNIGTSTTDMVFLHNKKLIKNQMISTGGYKLSEFIAEEGLSPSETTGFIKDYIYNYLIETKTELGRKRLSKLILITDAREIIMRYREESPMFDFTREDIVKVIDDISQLSYKNFAEEYDISTPTAIKSFVEMCILKTITDELEIDNIAVLSYDNKELLAYEYFYPEEKDRMEKIMWELSLQAAKSLGEKYHFNQNHSEFTMRVSVELFNKLADKQNIPVKILKYLEMANYLHDVGKYVNFNEHNKHSEYITKNSFIFGLSEDELEYISYLCSAHSGADIRLNDYLNMKSGQEKIAVLKALAILRLSTALDRSKKQKAEKVEIEISEDKLYIDIYTREEFLIEKLFFNKQTEFFRDVFGITPKLRINRRYYGESI